MLRPDGAALSTVLSALLSSSWLEAGYTILYFSPAGFGAWLKMLSLSDVFMKWSYGFL